MAGGPDRYRTDGELIKEVLGQHASYIIELRMVVDRLDGEVLRMKGMIEFVTRNYPNVVDSYNSYMEVQEVMHRQPKWLNPPA